MSDNDLASKQAGRIYNLDLIKILACIAVVGLHTLQKDISVINQSLYYICGFAVPAFFMSTGYVLLNRSKVSNKYSWNKIKNILKVVLLWSLLITMAYLFVHAIRNKLTTIDLLVLPQIFFGGLIQRGFLWQFWYLGALIIIYALYPILMKYRERLSFIWIISVTIGVIIQTVSYFIGTPLQSYITQTFRLWTWIQYFVLGGLIGSHNNKGNISIGKRAAICIILTISIVAYQNIMGKTFLHNTYAEYFYDSILTVMWLITIFKFIINIKISLSVNLFIKNISPITMGIYIIHPLISSLLLHFLTISTISESLLFFLIVLFLSSFVTYLIKRTPLSMAIKL